MRIHITAFSLAVGLVWGAAILMVASVNLFIPTYGHAFLEWVASAYPGYYPGTGAFSLLVGTLYGWVDGMIAGALLAWIYNFLVRKFSCC